MKRKPCPAARKIMAELAVDLARSHYQRTRSHSALVRLKDAILEAALKA